VSSFAGSEKELIMSLNSFSEEPCPRCRKPIRQTTIELHPTNRELALHNYECAECGPVKTKIISLNPNETAPKLTA
jgi:hypothetical protein